MVSEATREKTRLEGSEINGRYVLSKKLGEGGMGVVYKAKQLSTQRDVALKVLKISATDETSVSRFQREIDVISQLSHPNIVRIYDTGTIKERNLLFIVMELVEGLSLHELMWHRHEESKYFKCRLAVELALEVAYQVCAALTEPHRLGVIHRDIKPENILLTPRSDETVQVKLLDFGIARMTRRRGSDEKAKTITNASIPFVGTPHYMAPEQVANSEYDSRADLYSLGVLLYEMLSATYPFDDENMFALLLRKTQYDPDPLSERIRGDFPYPEVLELVSSLLERAPSDRPQSAIKVRRRIEAIRDHYRMRRVRVDGSPLFDALIERERDPSILDGLDDDERLEPGRSVFRSWLLYPSGRPLLDVTGDRDTVPEGHVALAERLTGEGAESEVEDDDLEEGFVPPSSASHPALGPNGEDPRQELESEEPVRSEPVRRTMQSWSVSSEWTNSFKVGELQRGVEEMLELFEAGDDSSESESIDDAVTNIWQPDLSEAPEHLRKLLGGSIGARPKGNVDGKDHTVSQKVDLSGIDTSKLIPRAHEVEETEADDSDDDLPTEVIKAPRKRRPRGKRGTVTAANPMAALRDGELDAGGVDVALGATLDDWREEASREYDRKRAVSKPDAPRESSNLVGQTHNSGAFAIGPSTHAEEDEDEQPTELTASPFAVDAFEETQPEMEALDPSLLSSPATTPTATTAPEIDDIPSGAMRAISGAAKPTQVSAPDSSQLLPIIAPPESSGGSGKLGLVIGFVVLVAMLAGLAVFMLQGA